MKLSRSYMRYMSYIEAVKGIWYKGIRFRSHDGCLGCRRVRGRVKIDVWKLCVVDQCCAKTCPSNSKHPSAKRTQRL